MKPQIDILESYLNVIRNSPGTPMFRSLIVAIEGKPTNITKDGILSCAYFVSSILHMFQLIDTPHATVAGTVRAMEEAGWYKVEPATYLPAGRLPGAVLVWEEKFAYGSSNKHIGFYVSDNMAISNDPRTRVPKLHHWTFGEQNGKPARAIEAIFLHDNLTKNQQQ
jgi:hypothetical protein